MDQDQGVGREVKRLREERGWSQAKLAVAADMSVSGVSMIENGHRNLSTATLVKLAKALGVEVRDLFPLGQPPLLDYAPVFEEMPSLEELHEAAGLETNWLVMPEEEWQASWPLSLTPHEAMQIVREMAAEFSALKPRMAAQEQTLPISKRAISGRYRQAWQRFFRGMEAAHACGVANGVVTWAETLNDLAEKLGEKPEGESYEELLLAG